jgi:hypothetical protein
MLTAIVYPAGASLHNTMPLHLQPDNEDDSNREQCPTLVLLRTPYRCNLFYVEDLESWSSFEQQDESKKWFKHIVSG